MSPTFDELETVVLDRDLPEYRLRKGDVGAVVQVFDIDHFEVEFVTASGRTQALVTLKAADLRRVEDGDLITVRKVALDAA